MTAPAAIAACKTAELGIARFLLERYAASLPFDLGFQGFAVELAGLPAPYVPPAGELLLARERGDAIGIVGLKPLSPAIGEIKRLYVVPEARGRGIGEALLSRAVGEARRIGYAAIRLDSHRPSMIPAIALYGRLGFVEIPPYGPDLDGTIAFFEKILV